jgi:hypothetical protein
MPKKKKAQAAVKKATRRPTKKSAKKGVKAAKKRATPKKSPKKLPKKSARTVAKKARVKSVPKKKKAPAAAPRAAKKKVVKKKAPGRAPAKPVAVAPAIPVSMPPHQTAHLQPSASRQAVIAKCLEHYDVGSPEAEWPNNMISRLAVVFDSGAIIRQGKPIEQVVSEVELDLCRRLSQEIAGQMSGVEVGMASNSGDEFHDFYIAALGNGEPPERIDQALIRQRFGGTIFPLATITVEPLKEAGVWWEEVVRDGEGLGDEYLAPWRRMIAWFQSRPEFRERVFVRIGEYGPLHALSQKDYPPGTQLPPGVLPRLALGLTQAGSLVGLFGVCVQT